MARRVAALDGLRGLAALIVVVHHCMFVSPAIANFYRPEGRPNSAGVSASETPLHLLWAGSEAVWVFFVLSGLVLTMPFLRPTPTRWRSYYPQRLARLYLPVWASVALGLVLALAVTRSSEGRFSWWINAHDIEYGFGLALRAGALLLGPTEINNPLWSLQSELLFSLLLPLYVFVARSAVRLPWLAAPLAVGALVVIAVGAATGSGYVTQLPMFALGSLLAARQQSVRAWGQRLSSSAQTGWTVVALLSISVSFTPWQVPAGVQLPANVVGACLLVALFMSARGASRFGSWWPVHWLGQRSFSLYLIHVPIVVTCAFLFGWINPLLSLLVCLPLSLAVADIFWRCVEEPSRKASARIGRAAGGHAGPPAATGGYDGETPRSSSSQ